MSDAPAPAATTNGNGNAKEPAPADPAPSKVGKFVTKYPTFISSLVVGVAGLIATTIWQYRNYKSQRDNNEAQQKIAKTQADNAWKIERTEILGKQMSVLAQTGSDTADQRYGVLLSLTRAEIIDPELAVSYALELGKDNPDYMISVLASTQNKEYWRIVRAFSPSCEQVIGRKVSAATCPPQPSPRSQALMQLVSDEVGIAIASDPASVTQTNPLVLFKDEKRVQREIVKLAALFEPTLVGMYERRAWDEIDKLEQVAPAARLLVALVMSAASTGELVTEDEQKTLADFHARETKWLVDYIAGKSCDADCKGRMIEVMLTRYAESQGNYDAAMKKLLESPRAQSSIAIQRLHARLLWCLVDQSDLEPLRDNVLVPAASALLGSSSDASTRDAVMTLLAVVDEPAAGTPAAIAWAKLVAQLDKTETIARAFRDRRATALRQRQSPPTPALRKVDLCLPPPAQAAPSTATGTQPPATTSAGSAASPATPPSP